MFFHDEMGGDFIAVVWKPQVYEKHQFKVRIINDQFQKRFIVTKGNKWE
jgi:hypothetical protein